MTDNDEEDPVSTELTFWRLFADASLLVQGIMLLLLSMSVVSWALIIQYRKLLKQTMANTQAFEDEFYASGEFIKLYDKLRLSRNFQGSAGIFFAAMKDFLHIKGCNFPKNEVPAHLERSMRAQIMRERDTLQSNLNWLATIGSVSPYIGLFGTVWGIMHSFIALGGVQQATLSMVAPGIAEALVATAMGLFAAIPAVVAYNRFSSRINRLVNRYQTFGEDVLGALSKKIYAA
jgi:biopolymer transport protein TolQ